MAGPIFKQLNEGWNAYPNGSTSFVDLAGDAVAFRFDLNPYAFDGVEDGDTAVLIFPGCSRWRLGATNDEGRYRGQCRYSHTAPAWGEFYEIAGEDPDRDAPEDWHVVSPDRPGLRHFLFYLKDETFECIALDWGFSRVVAS